MVTQVTPADLQTTLEDRGYRITGPRRDVIALLGRKQEGFSTEEIAAELPEVGRATVYRTIKLLLEMGAICKLALPDGAPMYTLSRIGHHHHTVCIRCGVAGDFRGTTVKRLLRTMGSDISGEIVGHRVEFYIICQSCLDNQKN